MSRERTITEAVIRAAGLGTRFRPATRAMPKEMPPAVDKPVIQYVVEEAVAAEREDSGPQLRGRLTELVGTFR